MFPAGSTAYSVQRAAWSMGIMSKYSETIKRPALEILKMDQRSLQVDIVLAVIRKTDMQIGQRVFGSVASVAI